ncbi:MAG: type II toxin-antitoxin system VapC family toxin, partial [Nitrososphaera sp.]
LWETAIKAGQKKVVVNLEDLEAALAQSGFQLLPIKARHARAVAQLPSHHRDPFDRMLVAQSFTEPLYLLTHDAELQQYSSELVIVV